MCSQRSRLYQARALEPVVDYDEVLMVMDQNGPLGKGPYYGVTGIEPITGPGAHGVLMIWAHAAQPAGYGPAPANLPIQAIAAGGNVQFVNPPALQVGPGQLLQVRFQIEPVALAGPVAQDIDLQLLQGAIPRFGIPGTGAPGSLNMAEQFQEPGDAIGAGAQGGAEALPAAFPSVHPRDQGNLTEFFIFENNGPTFRLVNNGVITTGGAIGLRLWGYRYVLALLSDPGDGSWGPRWLAGKWQQAPLGMEIVTVPIATALGGSAA
jgi:hypothetical protein